MNGRDLEILREASEPEREAVARTRPGWWALRLEAAGHSTMERLAP